MLESKLSGWKEEKSCIKVVIKGKGRILRRVVYMMTLRPYGVIEMCVLLLFLLLVLLL